MKRPFTHESLIRSHACHEPIRLNRHDNQNPRSLEVLKVCPEGVGTRQEKSFLGPAVHERQHFLFTHAPVVDGVLGSSRSSIIAALHDANVCLYYQ